MENLSFRYAEEKDVPRILFFIREPAAYENMSDEVVATEELLKEWVFEKKKAEVLFYLSLGAEAMEDWTVCRLAGDRLKKMAE